MAGDCEQMQKVRVLHPVYQKLLVYPRNDQAVWILNSITETLLTGDDHPIKYT